MLTTLRIKNLALVTDLTLELKPGFNAITGETGAGKSILIGALTLVLGERADRTLIRSGAEGCSVEAVFDVAGVPLEAFLDENGLEPCEDGQLVLKRTFTTAGTNRQFINGSPTTLNVLAMLGELLVDIHGPHDHQSLLHTNRQLSILDKFGGLETHRETLAGLVRQRAGLEQEKASLIVDERTYAQQLDLLRHQVKEITAAKLNADEDAEIEQAHRRSSSAARLLELGQNVLGALSEDDASLLVQAGAIGRSLQELHRLDPTAADLVALHEQAVGNLRELQEVLSHYIDKLEVDPRRLQELEERLDLMHSLKRKYGATISEVIAFGNDAQQRLRSLESRDAELERLNADLKKIDGDLWELARELSNQRRKLLPKLSKAVERQLGDLGFKQSHFDVALTSVKRGDGVVSTTGIDSVEFQFAPNPGEMPRSLRAIASSGEMARVMLALKTVLAGQDEIPVLVFDEVDANVGGETAAAVGDKMRQIAAQRQVLCITHLAQVAACATAHYVVSKRVAAGRTTSEIALITEENRITELARMLGGQSEAARKHAEALVGPIGETGRKPGRAGRTS